MAGINSHLLNLRNPVALNPGTYTVDGRVTQYGKTGNKLKEYRIVGSFPTDVSPIDVDWGSNDVMEEFTVTLAYQWWDSISTGVV